MTSNHQTEEKTISQTDHFVVWRTKEEGDYIYHIELGGITLHLLSDEWEELVTLFKAIP